MKKILFILPYCPTPPDSGNKNLTYGLFKYMNEHARFDVALLVDEGPAALAEVEQRFRAAFPNAGQVKAFSKPQGRARQWAKLGMVAQGYHPALGGYANDGLRRWLRSAVRAGQYDVVHFDMFHTAIYRGDVEGAATVLVASDAYSMAADTARRQSSGLLPRAKLWLESRMFRRFEAREYPRFDAVCTVSSLDAAYLAKVASRARLHTIGIAVASEYAERPIAHFENLRGEQLPRILVTGTLSHEVVAQGALDFLKQSLPLIRQTFPRVQLTVLGKDPVPELKACIESAPGVTHVSFAPDYAGFLDQDWVYLYPQRCGSGLQTKVQQALSLGLPVVGYDVSFGGQQIEAGRHAFVCHSAPEVEQAILALMGSAALRRQMGEQAASHIRNTFSIERMGAQMMGIYDDAMDLRRNALERRVAE